MEKMTRLFLIRHGETEWNKSLKYQGRQDIPLSEEGRTQARRIAARLAGAKLDGVYSSDLSRAVETAQIISACHNLEVNPVPELRETDFGCWEGLTYPEINEQFHEVMKKWRTNPRETKIPGGESLGEVADRCWIGLNQIIEANPNRNILVVTHGGIIRITVATILGMSLNEYWKVKQDNGCLNIIEFYKKSRAILCLLNDTGHLDPEPAGF